MSELTPNVDRGLVQDLVTVGGMTEEAAVQAVEAVFGVTRARLMAGKRVSIPGVGVLVSSKARRWINTPGPYRGKAIEEHKARLLHGALLHAGEPYVVAGKVR